VKGRAATTLTNPLESWQECVRRARADKAELQYTIDRLREFNQALIEQLEPSVVQEIRDELDTKLPGQPERKRASVTEKRKGIKIDDADSKRRVARKADGKGKGIADAQRCRSSVDSGRVSRASGRRRSRDVSSKSGPESGKHEKLKMFPVLAMLSVRDVGRRLIYPHETPHRRLQFGTQNSLN
jgi:hypothetical protein